MGTKMKQATEVDKGWIAVRRGPIYCAPLCGAKCTHAAFVTATRKAKALAKRLGKGWEPRVWENMGWHFEVTRGAASMHVNTFIRSKSSYTVYFNSARQFVVTGDTPEDALRLAIGAARLVVGKINKDLREIAHHD